MCIPNECFGSSYFLLLGDDFLLLGGFLAVKRRSFLRVLLLSGFGSVEESEFTVTVQEMRSVFPPVGISTMASPSTVSSGSRDMSSGSIR